jgi:bifunctional non-homologous end joining protein LigD
VLITHPERIYFPEPGITKGEVLAYYRDVAPFLLPHLAGRPLVMERWPEGITGQSFYQKDLPTFVPEWLRRHTMEYRHAERTVHHPLVDDVADLLYLVNLGTLTLHAFLSTALDLEHPDHLVIDIDPPHPDPAPGARLGPPATSDAFALAVETALLLRDELVAAGMDPLVKTSGKHGLHLALPLDGSLDFAEVRASLTDLFDRLIRRHPDRLTRESRLERREGRVYLDALRMALGATVVPPYVVRPTPQATVSMPVTWQELGRLESPAAFTVRTAAARLARTGDLWAALAPTGTFADEPEGEEGT